MEQIQPSITDKRNYGLDALKILSMIYVVILHALGMGGVVFASKGGNHLLIMILFFWCSCAVNIFALTTGYVSYTGQPKKLNRERIFSLWFQVVFYGLIIVSVFFCVLPDRVTVNDLYSAVLPLFSFEYWYYSAYFVVYLLSPFINMAVRSLPETTLRKTVVVVVLVFSFFSLFANNLGIVQPFSFTWVFVLYFLGASIKKCGLFEKLSNIKLICGIVICTLISFGWYIWVKEISFVNSKWDNYLLSKYISPTMLMMAVCYLILFKRIKFGEGFKKILRFLSPCVFASYLINTHPVVYLFMYDLFVPFTKLNILLTILCIVVYAVLFVICACLIDKVRMLLFKLVRLDKLAGLLGVLSGKIVEAIGKRL